MGVTEEELLNRHLSECSSIEAKREDWPENSVPVGMRSILSIQTMITIYLVLLLLMPIYA
jgi:hypothetical protein